MSEPFIGEIRAFGFHFAPRNWAFCNGQQIPIQQNTALFSIIGTAFGGDGSTTFNLPDFQERAPMHWGHGPGLSQREIGEQAGSATVTLRTEEMPSHSHTIQTQASGVASQKKSEPSIDAWLGASGPPGKAYNSTAVAFDDPFSPKAIGVNGGSAPHQNLQPILALNFCIALTGIFPARN
jgi:microcystin-dependent protein